MFVQLFRNKIYENRRFKYRIRKLESFIKANLALKEPDIVNGLADFWNKQGDINLGHFHLGGNKYKLFVEFYHLATHGPQYVSVNDKIYLFLQDPEYIEYKTEYGDLALVVDYWLEDVLLARRISILQTKKEKSQDKVNIQLHQQYLMQFWPPIEFTLKGRKLAPQTFRSCFFGNTPDVFSFYHFILNHHRKSPFSSSLCSAHLVGEALGITRWNLQKSLINWCKKKQTNPRVKPPSRTLSLPLDPGHIYQHGKSYKWNRLAKPFSQFILDAAYQYVGTEQADVLQLALLKAREKGVILAMKVVGGREGREFRRRSNDIYENRREKGD